MLLFQLFFIRNGTARIAVAGEEGTSRTKSAALKRLQPDEDDFVGETMVVADLLETTGNILLISLANC